MKIDKELYKVFKEVGLGSNTSHKGADDYGITPLAAQKIRERRYLIEMPKLVKRYRMTVGRYQIYGKDSLEVVL